ncbi:MAG: RNA polymerase subunit sigma-70 [Thermoleophilia bacterium]|nr:RNA polymerase subunit sigma-70 [Thermoleophilia bacterium]
MSTEGSGSVTCWIEVLKGDGRPEGLDRATRALWERYYDRLVRLARSRLKPAAGGLAPAGFDEEDVALSAFHTFCRMASDGRFPRLDDRDDLWRLLVTLTARKAANQRKAALRKKRGGGQVLDEAAINGRDDAGLDALAQVVGDEPTPEFAAMVAEEFRRLLGVLRKPEFVTIALRKFEGHTNAEIAREFGCVERTIERKLDIIRRTWIGDDRAEDDGPSAGPGPGG